MNRLAGMIWDNPLTRGWSDLVTNQVIRPAERFMLGDEAAGVISGDTSLRLGYLIDRELAASGGQVTPELQAFLTEHLGEGKAFDRLGNAYGAMEQAGMLPAPNDDPVLLERKRQSRALQLGAWAADHDPYEAGSVTRPPINVDETLRLRDAVLAGQPATPYTNQAVLAQTVLGNPVAAYLATGAGGWAAVEAARKLWGLLPQGQEVSDPGTPGSVPPAEEREKTGTRRRAADPAAPAVG